MTENKEHLKGHRERLRKKYLAAGMNGLHDYEMLELLLTYAIPMKDVKPIAKRLLETFESITGVLDASHGELCAVKGISTRSATLIGLMKDICAEYLAGKMKEKEALSSPEAVRNFARMKLSGFKDEAFMMIYLDTKNQVINYEIINEGTIDHAIVYPRNIIKKALDKNATGIIMIHNHPSGICDPSPADIKLTISMKDSAKLMNIKIIDHIIVGKSGCYSFVESGILS